MSNMTNEEILNYLEDDGLGGFESLSQDTVAIPFLRILQQLSPQLDDTKPEFIPEAKKGMFCSGALNKVYTAPLEVVVGRFDRYFVEWRPNRGGFVGIHAPEDVDKLLTAGAYQRDAKNRIIDKDSGNTLTDTYIYYVLLTQHLEDGLMILSLSGTQLKEARSWNRKLISTILPGTNQRAKPYHMKWNLTTPLMQNDQGSWYGLRCDFAGWLTKEQFSVVRKERAALPSESKPDLNLLESENGSAGVIDVQTVDTF